VERGVQGIEQDSGGAQLSVGWLDGFPEQGDQSLERAAAYAAILSRTLVAAGWQPRRLDVGVRRGAHGILELTVHGDIPRMAEADFARLARVTLYAAKLAQDVDGRSNVLFAATLDPPVADTAHILQPSKSGGVLSSFPFGRLAAALVLGLVLGVLGLPRLELSFLTPTEQPSRAAVPVREVTAPAAQTGPASVPELPVPLLPTPVVATRPQPTPTAPVPQVMFGARLLSPLPNWPNNPNGPAWFGADGFRLYARESGRFVAVGVPLAQPLGTAVLTARFHKVGGPAGGGYGLIVRDQGSSVERDGRNQAGKYMVLEVGDQGDAGIWQRNEARWIDVMPWTHSDAVHLDRESNALVVSIRDNVLRFEVNGQVLADLTYDGVPPRGGVGIFVGGDLNEVVLDSLRIES
jgi:hypothetical protein